MKILVVEPGRRPVQAELDGSLKVMQAVVGGCIQALYPFDDPVALICNEEGRLLGLPLNRGLRDANGALYDIVAGTFFLCGAPPDSDRFESLPEELTAKYEKLFGTPELFLRIGGTLLCIPAGPLWGNKTRKGGYRL